MSNGVYTVDFSDWVDDVGGLAAAAELLGENYRTVRSWYYLNRAPSARAAGRITRVAAGRVDYNGIYKPFVDAQAVRDKAAL